MYDNDSWYITSASFYKPVAAIRGNRHMSTVIGALLPLIVTLAFGFFAGWHHDFNGDQASLLTRMVMLYALPVSLFAGIVTTSRAVLTRDIGLIAAIAAAMLSGMLVTILVSHYLFRRDLGFSALAGLAVGGPSVPFAGSVVLPYLFGKESVVAIAAGAIVLSVILIPVTLILLELAAARDEGRSVPTLSGPDKPPTRARTRRAAATDRPRLVRAGAPAGPATVGIAAAVRRTEPQPSSHAGGSATRADSRPSDSSAPGGVRFGDHVVAAVKEPVVWAPVAALVIILVGISVPGKLDNGLRLLGSASTGVALFATGIVLYTKRVAFSRSVIAIAAARNVLVPAVLWAALAALGAPHTMLREAILTLALPTATAPTIFSVQYGRAEREMASILFVSTLLAVLTLAGFITFT